MSRVAYPEFLPPPSRAGRSSASASTDAGDRRCPGGGPPGPRRRHRHGPPGTRACVAAGSRGIDRIDEVVGAVVERLREAGADVFIVPAMGSHGGATAEGQLAVLAGYGITPASMGCEIRSSMDTVDLGEVVPGVPVFVDRNAFEGADLIVPVNRVKPHTGFAGPSRAG